MSKTVRIGCKYPNGIQVPYGEELFVIKGVYQMPSPTPGYRLNPVPASQGSGHDSAYKDHPSAYGVTDVPLEVWRYLQKTKSELVANGTLFEMPKLKPQPLPLRFKR